VKRERRRFPAFAAFHDLIVPGGNYRRMSDMTPGELMEASRLGHAAIAEIEGAGRHPRIWPWFEMARHRAAIAAELAARKVTRDTILSVSMFCAALAGGLDAQLAALLAEHVRDPEGAAGSVALDLVEERGHDGTTLWPAMSVEWPWIEAHEHAWLPYRSGGPPAIGALYRCPCGRFSNGYHAGRYQDGRRIIDVNRDGFGVIACSDGRCQRERDHRGLHMSRTWDAQAGLEIIDEWGNVDLLADAALHAYQAEWSTR
jgi:hypothetical protein